MNEVTLQLYAGTNGFETLEHNLGGLWHWEQDVVNQYFVGLTNVLVAGAGGGRELISLARQGFAVTGFDFCKPLTIACRRHLADIGLIARVLDAKPSALPSELATETISYDAIYIGRGFYHHIPGRIQRVAFLEGCRSLMCSGAPIFLSDFYTREIADSFFNKTFIVANTIRRLRHSPDAVEVGDWFSNCMQHAFLPEEIETELGEAGFSLAFYANSPFGQGSHLAHAVGIAQ